MLLGVACAVETVRGAQGPKRRRRPKLEEGRPLWCGPRPPDEEADSAGPGAGGVIALPYFLGEKTPINDPEATGAFTGLRLTQDRGHLFRAVLEGVAFSSPRSDHHADRKKGVKQHVLASG